MQIVFTFGMYACLLDRQCNIYKNFEYYIFLTTAKAYMLYLMTANLYPLPTSIPLGNGIYLYKIKAYNDDLIFYFLFIAISIYLI